MITILIFFLITFFCFYSKFSKDNFIAKSENILFSILFGLLGAFLGALVCVIIPSNTYYKKTNFELEGISDGSKLSGKFFLGSGYINEKMKYSYYLKEEDGFKLYSIDADIAHVKYSENEPYLEMYELKKTDDIINYFSIPLKPTYKYIIYVPQGSILQNYTLDAN